MLSAFSANSAGQSVDDLSCDNRPFETFIAAASCVRDIAPSRFRYCASVDMHCGLDRLNYEGKQNRLAQRNALFARWCYDCEMALPRNDWYLKEWLRTLGKKQSDIVNDLDWNKAKVSLTASGKQPYTRDDVNEISLYLNLLPYELLMHPEDAMALRRLRQEMMRLAYEEVTRQQDNEPTEVPKRVSTN